MKRTKIAALVAIPAIVAIGVLGGAGAASASVAVTTNGSGWVGKGDVQNALGGINNAAIQTLVNNNEVKFTYTVTDTYLVTEEWYTGPDKNRKQHEVTKDTTYVVDAMVASDARQVKGQKQWTGFNLSGFEGAPTIVGTVPNEGDITVVDPQNPGTNSDHIITEVTPTGSTGGLFVNGHPLPNTPIVLPTA
jgi:hypothetical protein